jgi:hypothetical protein
VKRVDAALRTAVRASRICKQLAADGIGMLRFVGVGGDQDCAAWLARAQPNPGDVGAVFS